MLNKKTTIVRITTVPVSLQFLLKGQIQFMQENGFHVYMVSGPGEEIDVLKEQEQASHTLIALTRKINPLKDVVALIQLVRFLNKVKADIVHTHTPKAGLIGILASRISNVPIRIHTIAGLPWINYKGGKLTVFIWLEKLLFLNATHILVNSLGLQQFLLSNGFSQKRMRVLGKGSSNGIDLNWFKRNPTIEETAALIRKRIGSSPTTTIWIFIGRLVLEKGIAEVLDAFEMMKSYHPMDRLLLLGELETDLYPLPEKYLSRIKNDPAIFYEGFQQDIRPYLVASDALLFPSYREGFPNVPMQAALMNCFVIASDINGCNEIVKHEHTGLLVPPGSVEELYSAMFRFNAKKIDIEIIKQEAFKYVSQNFAREKVWQDLLELYRQCLKNKQASIMNK